MSDSLRGFVRTHRGEAAPLTVLHRQLAEPDAASTLSTGLPATAVHAARTFYADLESPSGRARACAGTACHLASGSPLDGHRPDDVHCLGYCHAAPARLEPDGTVVAGGGTDVEVRALCEPAIVTARLVRGDFSDLDTARAGGAYATLRAALDQPPESLLATIDAARLRGRGGAGFPTGRKWRTCAETPADRRYVVVNGDEGDPGSFVDRLLLERDPHAVIEGLCLAALAVGADRGILFIRSEYPAAIARARLAVAEATAAGLLPPGLEVTVQTGYGSYVCGEETALLNALEGFRGEVRLRPPYPAEAGLYGRPTVVNNVETIAAVPWIVAHGAAAYTALGTPASAGTKALCFDRGFARPGLVEVEFGAPLRELIESVAGGGRDGRPLEALILGGPMGSYLTPDRWDVPVCYEAMGRAGVQLGHGGLVAVPEGTDPLALLRHWLRFMATESCGKCVPCRLGSRRALELVERGGDRFELELLLEVMAEGSLCGFGQLLPNPIRELLEAAGDRLFPAGGAR